MLGIGLYNDRLSATPFVKSVIMQCLILHRQVFSMALIFAFVATPFATPVCAEEPAGPTDYELVRQTDFPWWRGNKHSGQADPDQKPPTKWDAKTNVIWRIPIPGRGHGSATVLENSVYITAADLEGDSQIVYCVHRESGEVRWTTPVHKGGLKTKGNRKQNNKASLASTTIATNGERLYVNFLNDEAIWTTCLSLTGGIVWQKKVSDYVVHQGYGSSPTLYRDSVIVSADNKGGGAIVALHCVTGKELWRHKRPAKPNYSSPVVLNVGRGDQLFMIGCDLVTSLNPTSGKVNWEIEGATTECVTTTVTDGKHIFSSGGYPKNHIAAVKADGSGVSWEIGTRVYVPSLLCQDNHLFAVMDAGVAICIDCKDGAEVWKKRLGGTFSASPSLVGDLIYAVNEEGEWFVFKAQTDKFELVAENKLGDSVFATPTICNSRIYARVALDQNGKRQEYLYCLGE